MKVLLVESEITGHHMTYLNSLCNEASKENEVYIVVPDRVEIHGLNKDNIFVINKFMLKLNSYIKWINEINKIVKEIKPDIVHFLYGDEFYRFFGIGINKIRRKAEVVTTYHHIRRSKLRDLSSRLIAKKSSYIVVHTSSLVKTLEELKTYNVRHIEYPQFSNFDIVETDEARRNLNIKDNSGRILLALGGTREDKGLDILLMALDKVKNNFYLIIAGKEEDIKRQTIDQLIGRYKNNVLILLKYLDDKEMNECISACDTVVLPYRKQFDGASGPLGQGVWANKMIIGPDHGSLGAIIRDNHLGITFESENIESLAKAIEQGAEEKWIPDSVYVKYREFLSPARFNMQYMELYKDLFEKHLGKKEK